MMLLGIKNCHCCLNRVGCSKKTSKTNLLKKPKLAMKIMLPKIRGIRVPTDVEVASFCADFGLERHKAERR